jgi:glycosyltransferase involved in cell wall biosynthesis
MNKIFQVAVVTQELSPSTGGGYSFTSTILNEILASRNNSNFEVKIFTTKSSKSHNNSVQKFAEEKLKNSLIFRFYWIVPSLSYFFMKNLGLYKKLKKQNIDFVFFLGVGAIPLDIPYGMVVWDLQHRTHPWFPEVNAGTIWQNREISSTIVTTKASLIVVGTPTGKDQVQHFYRIDPSKIKIIPHPVTSSFVNRPLLNIQSAESLFKFIYPAQFWAHKNHKLLLEASKVLLSSGVSNFQFRLIGGDKGNLQYIKNLVQEFGLQKHVIFLGFVSDTELASEYENATALVYPSFSGPENLPPLEAMQCNLPVIIANYEGAYEQLGEAALYFNPFNSRELADQIIKLIGSKELQEKLRHNGNLVVMEKTVSKFVENLFESINSILKYRETWHGI